MSIPCSCSGQPKAPLCSSTIRSRTAPQFQQSSADCPGLHWPPRVEFNFAERFSALTGARGNVLIDEVEGGFPFLPGASRAVPWTRSRRRLCSNRSGANYHEQAQSARWADVRVVQQQILGAYLAQTRGELSDLCWRRTRAWIPWSGTPAFRPRSRARRATALTQASPVRSPMSTTSNASPHTSYPWTQNCPPFEDLTTRNSRHTRRCCLRRVGPIAAASTHTTRGLAIFADIPRYAQRFSQLLDVAADNIEHVAMGC